MPQIFKASVSLMTYCSGLDQNRSFISPKLGHARALCVANSKFMRHVHDQ